MNNRILAIFVWIAAEALLQIHGVRFWQQHGGWHGWLWSVALCVVTVWFWLHHRKEIRYTFGVLASLLLLAGPLWQVGAPLAVAVEQRYTQQRNVTLQIATLRNSEARTGWAPLIVAAQADLAATRSKLAEVTAALPAARAAFLSVAVIIIQLLSLIVLQVAAVAALLVIRSVSGVAVGSVVVPGVGVLKPGESVHWADPEVKDGASQMRPVALSDVGYVGLKPGETLHHASSKAPANSSAQVDEIKQRITAGHYGEQPSMRRVMDGEKKRHDFVKKVFHELVKDGVLVLNKKRFRRAVSR